MKFYRLESTDGTGVYCSYAFKAGTKAHEVQKELYLYHDLKNKARPNLYDDFNNLNELKDKNLLFACKSLKALKNWFDNGLFEKLIALRNVNIAEYESTSFIRGKSKLQYVFVTQTIPVILAKWKIKKLLAI